MTILRKTLSSFFYQDSKIKYPVWGLREPITEKDLNDYHADLVGALTDLEKLGFTFYMVNSYGNQVLVIKKALEITI